MHVRNLVSKTGWSTLGSGAGGAGSNRTAPGRSNRKSGRSNSRHRSIFRNKNHSSPFRCCAKSLRSIRRTSMHRQTSACCCSFRASYAEAIPHMRAALQMQPDLWRIQALLGIAEKRTGDPKEAQNDLERAFSNLDDKKIQIEAGLELIELHSASAQLGKALSVAAKLEELAPQNPADPVRCVSNFAADDGPEPAEHDDGGAGFRGDAHDHGRRTRRARGIAPMRSRNIARRIRLNPMLPGAHFELAEQLRTSPDPALNAQAEDEYKAALQVNQYDELAWRQLGGIMTAKGDFKAAEEDYRKALALQPKDSEAKTGLAIVLISTESDERSHLPSGKRGEGRSHQHRGALPSERAVPTRRPDGGCST